MKRITNYTVETLEKRILKVLAKCKMGAYDRILIEATNAEFCHYQFFTVLCNLQQQGLVAYNEGTESYVLIKR